MRTLKLCDVHPELVPLLQHALPSLFNESVETRRELAHSVPQLVKPKVGTRQRICNGGANGRDRLPMLAAAQRGLECGRHGVNRRSAGKSLRQFFAIFGVERVLVPRHRVGRECGGAVFTAVRDALLRQLCWRGARVAHIDGLAASATWGRGISLPEVTQLQEVCTRPTDILVNFICFLPHLNSLSCLVAKSTRVLVLSRAPTRYSHLRLGKRR